MSTDQTRRLLELIDRALDVREEQRLTWLRENCGDDEPLFSQAAEMLNLAPAAKRFLPAGDGHVETRAVLPDPTPPQETVAAEFAPGTQLGDFLIEEQIGAGGMGVVYRARQLALNRPVALKVLPAYLRNSPSANSRFRREIEAAARLHHTNIVSVYSTGEEAGALFYAMELIDGPPLSRVLQHLRENPIPELASTAHSFAEADLPSVPTPQWAVGLLSGRAPSEASCSDPAARVGDEALGDYFDRVASALADAAEALDYAHQRDVLHRDVKPSNLLLSREGHLHISDFGLARIMHKPALTRTGELLGTPYYMAPEQIAANTSAVDGRADIYGLGATLFELLTLRPPFVGETRERVIHQIQDHEPIPPRRFNARVPHDLQTICLKALQKDPADRYQSGAQMAADLRAYVKRFAISARPVSLVTRAGKWARRHPGLSAVMACACGLALVAAFFALRAHRTQTLWDEAQQHQVFEQVLMAGLEGQHADAEEALERARRLHAPPGKLEVLQGQIELMANRNPRAYVHFERAVKLLPDDLTAQSLLALTCLRRQLFDQGETIYRQLGALQPTSVEDYLHRARVEAYFEPDKAAQTLSRAVEQDRASLVARLIRAEVDVVRAIDTANLDTAERALNDYRLVRQLLGDTPLVTSGLLEAYLAAATACRMNGQAEYRKQLLTEAAQLAEQMADSSIYREQRALAFYYDYVGDVDRAVQQMRKFQHRHVVFLVLTHIRRGHFDQAREACQGTMPDARANRSVDFFRTLITAMQADSADAVRREFSIAGSVKLDPIHELLAIYTVSCLVDPAAIRAKHCQHLAEGVEFPSLRNGWYRQLSSFASGALTAEGLLAAAGNSRKSLCEAHYYLGAGQLAAGRRDEARRHFEASAATGVYSYLEHYLSRALAAQLDRDPAWPSWIAPASSQE